MELADVTAKRVLFRENTSQKLKSAMTRHGYSKIIIIYADIANGFAKGATYHISNSNVLNKTLLLVTKKRKSCQ